MKFTEADREAIRQLRDRMNSLWLEMADEETAEEQWVELHSIHEDLSRILGKYNGNAHEA